MKKILINLPIISRAGINLVWLFKFRRWQEKGARLFLFDGSEEIKELDFLAGDIYKFNGRFGRLSRSPDNKFGFIWFSFKKNLLSLACIKRIKKSACEVIHSPAAGLDMTFLPWCLKKTGADIKWTVIFDNLVPFSDPGNKLVRLLAWIFFQISLLLLKKADVIFAVTNDLKKYLLNKGFDKKKIFVTGNALEGDLIRKAQISEKHRTDGLFVGRINDTKGIYDLLKVLKLVRKKYPDFCLGIMGRGDDQTEKNFKGKIEELGLSRNIKFFGYVVGQEKFDIIKSSKVFLFLSTSESESFGVALLEAVCSGLPAFAYDLAPYQNIYRQGEVHICPIGDWQCLAEKILAVFTRGDFHNRAGLLLLDKYASWDKIADLEFAAIKKLSG